MFFFDNSTYKFNDFFLASDAAEYVAGQTMLVDGGITSGSIRALPAQK
jgi:NAD(P)-dependent dehydrogenase (short-subunit alcohol dehydrogenase family)